MQHRIDQIIELDETRREVFDHIYKNQFKFRKKIDKSSRVTTLQVGDLVLLWDRRNEKLRIHRKFDNLSLAPYFTRRLDGTNSFHLSTLDGEPLDLLVNGQMLKLFYKDNI